MNEFKLGESPQGPGQKPALIQRSIKNYLLQPGLQTVLGLYAIVLTLVFAVTVGTIFYLSFHDLYEVILGLTDVQQEVIEIIDEYMLNANMYSSIISITSC